jgi:hypothetical protein
MGVYSSALKKGRGRIAIKSYGFYFLR